jgi:hypothetical protein
MDRRGLRTPLTKLDRDTGLIVLTLHELLGEFVRELDFNGAKNITDFYTHDGVFAVADTNAVGHAAISQWYARRNALARSTLHDGVRVSRHIFVNTSVSIVSHDSAVIHFTNINFGGEGHAPVVGAINPAMITDCMMKCRLESDGIWRIAWFGGTPVFVGHDSFVNTMLLPA